MDFPPCPPTLKQIQHFLKIANEHDQRDIVVSYWCRLYALQRGLKMSSQSPEETKLLLSIMDWLENMKKQHADNEAITNDVVAQAHLENYALKLFLYADNSDRSSEYGKNVVKAFYCSSVVYDVLHTFGELTEEATHNCKYAKWRAAYIHNCLKNGEVPVPYTEGQGFDEDAEAGEDDDNNATVKAADGPADDGPAAGEGGATALPPPASPPPQIPPTDEEVLQNTTKLPSPPVDEEKPGGFEPFTPTAQSYVPVPVTPMAAATVTSDQIIKAQKYCKYAGSALNYDDVPSAIENLQKALRLLTTGRDE